MQDHPDNDAEALFRNWLREHAGLIFKVSGSFTVTEEDRQDLAQEILLQIWRSMSRFEPRAKVSTWLYRVALNTALAWRRKHRKERSEVPGLNLELLPAVSRDARLADDDELVAALYAAIRKLPRVDACLVLMFLDELSYRDMADVLGISEDHVGVKLTRARKSLAESMKEVARDAR